MDNWAVIAGCEIAAIMGSAAWQSGNIMEEWKGTHSMTLVGPSARREQEGTNFQGRSLLL